MRKFPPYLAGQPDQIMKEHLPVERVSVLSRERCSLEKNSTVFIFTYEIGFIWEYANPLLKLKLDSVATFLTVARNDNLIVFIYWYVSSLFSLLISRWWRL